MWRYGFYKAGRRHPDSLRLRQLAPPALLLTLTGTTLMDRRRGALLAGGYLVAAGALGSGSAARAAGSGEGTGVTEPQSRSR
jgi:succinoglycan biosynthesis protein ExoA